MTSFEELQQKFSEFKQLPFPENSANDELSDIFAELVQLDGHVAGLVTTFLLGKPVRRELVYIDLDLDQKLQAFQPSSVTEQKTVSAYQTYKSRLDELISFLQQLLR
jgi:hypothetical protein